MRDHLLLFSRFPVAGKTKTRLIPALGAEKAARLQELMTGHTLLNARSATGLHIRLIGTGGPARGFRHWLGTGLHYTPQAEGDLGHRMREAFRQSFESGAERVIVMGSDCPGITPEILHHAYDALARTDVVVGPASDGGYVLLGLNRLEESLFTDIPWGGPDVLASTRTRAREAGLEWIELDEQDDVDEQEDLKVWDRVWQHRDDQSISVILPARNEEASIRQTIEAVRPEALEVLVVDGGSSDQTVSLAIAAGARVLHSPPGRGQQLNVGAREAKGDFLLFLHADARLPNGYSAQIRSAYEKDEPALGAFSLKIDAEGHGFRWIEWGVAFRSRYLRMPYGDQALFCKRESFVRRGGFMSIPLFEDVEFVKRSGRDGPVHILNEPVSVSARRWKQLGLLKTTLINQYFFTAYHLGVPPETLAQHYQHPRRAMREDPQAPPRNLKTD